MIELFKISFAGSSIGTFGNIPVEDVASVVRLLILHVFGVGPETSFDKVNTCFLQLSVLDREPHIAFMIDFIDEFKERATFEESIADAVFDVCEHFEEGCGSDLGKAQNVS